MGENWNDLSTNETTWQMVMIEFGEAKHTHIYTHTHAQYARKQKLAAL